jgi:hypothetical protein
LLFEHEAVPPSDQFPDDLALHAPAYITAFDIPSQTWRVVSVNHLTDVKWETKAMDHLVLDEDKKLLLRSLVDDRNVKMSNRIGDVISGKGRVSQTRSIFVVLPHAHAMTGPNNRTTWPPRRRKNTHSR